MEQNPRAIKLLLYVFLLLKWDLDRMWAHLSFTTTRPYLCHSWLCNYKYNSLSRCGWPSDRRWAWRRWSGRRPACPWRSGTAGMAAGAPRCGPTPTAADQSESGYMCWLPNKTTDSELRSGHFFHCLITFIHILKLIETFFLQEP